MNSNIRTTSTSNIGYLPIFALPFASSFYASKQPDIFFDLTVILMLYVLVLLFSISYSQELLRFKKLYLVSYSALVVLACGLIYIEGSIDRNILRHICFAGLGSSILWVPGALRSFVYWIFRPLSRRFPGLPEAYILHFSNIPRHIQYIIDSKLYPVPRTRTTILQLLKRPWIVVRHLPFLIEFVIAVLVHIAHVSYYLASSKITRDFNCRDFKPIFVLHPIALSLIYLIIGVILCSFLKN